MNTEAERQLAVVKASKRKLWPEIKTAYLAGEGSLRELARRFDVSFSTLSKRAVREAWATDRQRIGDAVATGAMESTTAAGQKTGLAAAELVARQIRSTALLLAQVERNAAEDRELDPRGLSQVASAFRNVVEVGRTAYPELREAPPAAQVLIGQVEHLQVVWGQPAGESPGKSADALLPSGSTTTKQLPTETEEAMPNPPAQPS
jgi:transposase-like protein